MIGAVGRAGVQLFGRSGRSDGNGWWQTDAGVQLQPIGMVEQLVRWDERIVADA